jgi:hypothetical protein
MALIHEKMIAVMKDCDAISKDRRNQAQGYSFRGVDDVYNMLHVILSKHGVFTTSSIKAERSEERQTKSGGTSIYRVLNIVYTFHCEDGSFIVSDVVGEGMDSGDKASNKAMSVAHKYAMMQAFCIPTEDAKDPENDDHDVVINSPQYITKEQQAKMLSLLETIGDKTRLAKILGHYKVHSLDKIPVSAYTQIVNQLASQI